MAIRTLSFADIFKEDKEDNDGEEQPLDLKRGDRVIVRTEGPDDSHAVYQYLCHLMRRIAHCDHQFVVKCLDAPKKVQDSEVTSSCASDVIPMETVNTVQDSFNVLLVDELQAFDIRGYAATLPSLDSMKRVAIIQDCDPSICYISLEHLIHESDTCLSDLHLIVVFCSEFMISKMMAVMTEKALDNCTILIISPHLLGKTPEGYTRVHFEMSPKNVITISWRREEQEEEVMIRKYAVMGRRAARNESTQVRRRVEEQGIDYSIL